MPWSRPGRLAVRLVPLVRLPVGRPLVGRLTLPLVRLALAVRIPWRLLAHDALPRTAPGAVLSHFKDAPKTSEVC